MNGFNFTERVRRVLQHAREEATALRHEYVGTEHILLALVEGGGVADAALTNLGVNPNTVRQKVLDVVKPGPEDGIASATTAAGGILGTIASTIGLRPDRDLPYTSRAKKTLELSMSEARSLDHSYVGTEHLLLGLLREEKGIGAQVLTSMGVTTATVRDEVIRLLGPALPEHSPESAEPKRPVDGDTAAAITLVVEHPDGRIEAKKFRRTGDAVSFLKGLEY
jgi:ATP-dependent Clp protease ATP-binding subunit ClpC